MSTCGEIGSSKQLYITFKKVASILSLLSVSNETELTTCQQYKINRNHTNILKVYGGGQKDRVDRSWPLKLFMGHTFKRATARDNDRLEDEQVSWVCSNISILNEQNWMFAESFSSGLGWTNLEAMAKETIGTYVSIN